MKDYSVLLTGRNFNRRGWSLVETLIMTVILGFIFWGIFTVFSRMVRSTDTSAWKNSTQTKMRTSMKTLFQDLSQATYPSWIYPNKTEVDKTKKLQYREGVQNPWTGSGEILKFWICKPGKKNFPDAHPQHIIECTMSMEKYDDTRPYLKYTRKTIQDSGLEDYKGNFDQDFESEFFQDVDMLEFSPQVFEDESAKDPVTGKFLKRTRFALEIRSAHPKYPKATVNVRQNIILQVDVEGLEVTEEDE